jgi:hypothetical protein
MPSDCVVIAFDVFESFCSCFFRALENSSFYKLGRESGKEAFRLCIIKGNYPFCSLIAEDRKL